jgi:hypothetical protein
VVTATFAKTEAPDCAELVRRIRDGEAAAVEELYGFFARGVRYFLLRNLGQLYS